ncbi:PD40 domain-containing protein [bacterium]|nr:PD40 domain-containing protein [bacterium]
MTRKNAFLFVIFICGLLVTFFIPGQADAAKNDYKVVYQSMVDEEFQIFIIDLKNPSTHTKLTHGEYGSKHPSITTDGKRIYYYHWTPTSWGDMELLYYQNLPECKEHLVQRNKIHEENDPCISRDGSVLAYRSNQAIQTETGSMPNSNNWEILCVKTDFSVASRITQTMNDETAPCLNGTGDVVYFSIIVEKDFTEAEKEAKREAAENNEEENETEESKDEATVKFMPLAKHFPLASMIDPMMYPSMGGGSGANASTQKLDDDDDDNTEIDEESWEFNHYNVYYIFRNTFDGENLERITPRDYNAWHPSVDADEKWMVFASDMDGNDEIYIMDLESYEIKRLTEDGGYDGNPMISHDGQVIVFVSDRDGDKEIFRMNRNGGDLVQLTYNEVEDDNPAIT